MKGKRMIALWMLLIFGSFSVVLGFISSWILEAQMSLYGDLSGGDWWRIVTPEFILRIVMASTVFMMVLLSNAVALHQGGVEYELQLPANLHLIRCTGLMENQLIVM